MTKIPNPPYPTKVGPGHITIDGLKAIGPQGQRTRERLRPAAAQLFINMTDENVGYVALRLRDGRDAGRVTRDIVDGRLPNFVQQSIEGEPLINSVIMFFYEQDMSLLMQWLATVRMDYRLVDQRFNAVVEAPGGVLPLPDQPIVRS